MTPLHWVAVTMLVILGITGLTAATAQEGWYTSEQAERGQETYQEHCARCHSPDLRARATYISLYSYPALSGTYFFDRWEGQNLHTLFQIIQHTMPLDAPNSLSIDTYADITAFILQENGFPVGSEPLPLPREDLPRLEGLVIEAGQAQTRAAPREVEAVALVGLDEEEDAESSARPDDAPEPDPEAEAEEDAEDEVVAEDEAEDGMDTEEDEMDVEDGAREAFFTQEQAGRGEDAYLEHCARCHGDDLQGNPPLVGDDFLARWDSVAELFDYNRSQMPLDNPGSLDDDTYADITAFILHENDFPAGDEELPADPDRLENYPLDLDATDPDTTGPDTTDTEETEAEEDAEEPEPEEAPEEEPEEEPDEAAEVDEEPEEEVEPEDEAAEPVEDEAEDAAEDPVEDTAPEDEGWYSSEQAARGHRAYDEHCARCHGLALQGVGVAPSLAGMNFIARWEGESVADLFWITSALMPLDDQGALDSETYADLVAYILEQNGFPAGAAEFSPDSERLEGMTIRADQADVRERP